MSSTSDTGCYITNEKITTYSILLTSGLRKCKSGVGNCNSNSTGFKGWRWWYFEEFRVHIVVEFSSVFAGYDLGSPTAGQRSLVKGKVVVADEGKVVGYVRHIRVVVEDRLQGIAHVEHLAVIQLICVVAVYPPFAREAFNQISYPGGVSGQFIC